jgi:hypothetical protein
MPVFGKSVRLVAMFGQRSNFGDDLAIDPRLLGVRSTNNHSPFRCSFGNKNLKNTSEKMNDVFIEYNHKIVEFQAVLTFLAITMEALLILLGLAVIVSSITQNNEGTGDSLGTSISLQPICQRQLGAFQANPLDLESVVSVPPKVSIAAKPITVAELRETAKNLGLKGVARKNKAELLSLIKV